MTTRAEQVRALEREWWLHVLQVLYAPRSVFAVLRDDSAEAADARQEPLAAVVFLAGISVFLSTTTAGRLFDDFAYDPVNIVVESIIAGALVGLQNFWLGGGAVYVGARTMGATTGYRLARHLVGLALTPFVLSLLVVWPVRLAVFGGDLFRSGGSDEGLGGDVFRGIDAAFVAWTVVLVVIALRTVQGWPWLRAAGSIVFAALLIAIVGLAAVVL